MASFGEWARRHNNESGEENEGSEKKKAEHSSDSDRDTAEPTAMEDEDK
ncbi:MAG TPA: hypothetical protein VHF05_03020 [Candidatus Paceibacterota bacterium]|jgi:hypothetical protein|nr:hypothetical protein [Candidatus Paceibacterota bacterium]